MLRKKGIDYCSFFSKFCKHLLVSGCLLLWGKSFKLRASLVSVKNLPVMQETQVWSLGLEDALEEEMASHFSILTGETPWIEEPGRLESTGLQRVGADWAYTYTFMLSLFKCLSFLICNRDLWRRGLFPTPAEHRTSRTMNNVVPLLLTDGNHSLLSVCFLKCFWVHASFALMPWLYALRC